MCLSFTSDTRTEGVRAEPAHTYRANRVEGWWGGVRCRCMLRAARKALGLTKSEAAERCGIDRAMYSRVEDAMRQPSVLVTRALGQCFHLTMEEVLLVADVPMESEENAAPAGAGSGDTGKRTADAAG